MGDDEARVAGGRQHPRRAAMAGLDRAEQGDHDADEDRAVRIAEADVDVGRADRDRHGDQRPPVAHGQGRRSEQHQHQGEGVDRPAIGLVVAGAERADHLERADGERR